MIENMIASQRWRMRAEEARTIAEQLETPEAQAALRITAKSFDDFADWLEEREISSSAGPQSQTP